MEKSPETSTELSILDKLDQNKNELILVDEWKQKLELLVSENPFVEIVDSKSYELAKQRKAVFRNARLELRNTGKTPSQESVLIGKINSIKDFVKKTIDDLVVIPSTPEEKQSDEVSRWEGIKEAEKAEKERLENERIDAIKNKAVELESSAFEVIQKMTYSSIISDSDKVAKVMETEFDFEEYDILFTNAHSRVLTALEEKVKDLTERENQRIAKEKAEVELKRSQKLISSGFSFDGNNYFVSDFKRLDMGTILMLSEHEFESVISAGVVELNRLKEIEESKQKAQAEKAKKEKDAIFEIRKKRLLEVGLIYNGGAYFYFKFEDNKTNTSDYSLSVELVEDADVIDFENLLSENKEKIELLKSEKIKAEEQKEADEKASIADAEKLKAENKARVKKFAKDKKTLTSLIATVDYPDSVFVLENEESKEALNSFIVALADFKKEWIGKIEKI